MRTGPSLGLALTLLAFPSFAHAENLGSGMVYDATGGYHVVVADLDNIATEVRVPLPHANLVDDAVTVATHAGQEGATVAINANYFGGGPNYPCGLGRGFGQTYLDAYGEAGNCQTSLGWTTRGTGTIFDSGGHDHDPAFMTQFTDVVTGGGYLLSGGARRDWNHTKLEEGRDCTAVGISADRKHFIFVVTDSRACTGAGLQDALLAHGAADGIHLDGGGSSKMWIRGKGYVNNEVEDRAPSITVIARPNGQCPSDCGGALCVQEPRPWRAQCVGQPCRAGLTKFFNCDDSKLRRVKCDPATSTVVSEHCAMGCMAQAINTDDTCLGGTIPEPPPSVDAGTDSGRAEGGASTPPRGDGPTPPADAGTFPTSGDGGAAGGCALTSRPGDPAGLTLLAFFGALAVVAARRRTRG